MEWRLESFAVGVWPLNRCVICWTNKLRFNKMSASLHNCDTNILSLGTAQHSNDWASFRWRFRNEEEWQKTPTRSKNKSNVHLLHSTRVLILFSGAIFCLSHWKSECFSRRGCSGVHGEIDKIYIQNLYRFLDVFIIFAFVILLGSCCKMVCAWVCLVDLAKTRRNWTKKKKRTGNSNIDKQTT